MDSGLGHAADVRQKCNMLAETPARIVERIEGRISLGRQPPGIILDLLGIGRVKLFSDKVAPQFRRRSGEFAVQNKIVYHSCCSIQQNAIPTTPQHGNARLRTLFWDVAVR
jgi:hypothetical protein